MSHTRSVSIWLVVALALSLVAGSFGVSQVAANGAAPLSLSLPSAYVVASLPSGASGVAAEINGHTLFWNNVGGKMLLSLDQPSQTDGGNTAAAWPNFCRYAVTSALFGLGASVPDPSRLGGDQLRRTLFSRRRFRLLIDGTSDLRKSVWE